LAPKELIFVVVLVVFMVKYHTKWARTACYAYGSIMKPDGCLQKAYLYDLNTQGMIHNDVQYVDV